MFKLTDKIPLLVATRHRLRRAKWHLWQSVILISTIATTIVLGLRATGAIELLELKTFDLMMCWRSDLPTDDRLLIVAIDEDDLKFQQEWPLSDLRLATLLEKLQRYQPTVIGVDLYRNLPKPPGYEKLVVQLQKPNVITIRNVYDTKGVPQPPSAPPHQVGFNDLLLDADGPVRRNLLFASSKLYSFSLRLSLTYLQTLGIEPQPSPIDPQYMQIGQAVFIPLTSHSGGYINVDQRGYQILLNYRNRNQVARQVSLTDVFRDRIDPNFIKNKIVLIGTSAPSLKDLFFTPYSGSEKDNDKMPGILLHAQMTSQIVSAALGETRLFWFWPEWGQLLWIGFWTFAGGFLVWKTKLPLNLALGGGVLFLTLAGITVTCFLENGWLPVIAPTIGLAIAITSVLVYKLRYDTYHDPLTGLPNRALFIDYLEKIIQVAKGQEDYLCAVLLIDLDNFKVINNSCGHEISDQLLLLLSQRLNKCLKIPHILARFGGDEFVVLVENVPDIEEVKKVAELIQQELCLPFKISGQELFTSATIGIAIGESEKISANEQLDLLQNAHTALDRAKILSKSSYQIFEQSMQLNIVARLQLESDLRRGLEAEEFLVYYQPLVCLKTGKIKGFEALVRWQHPHRGLVFPGEFIPVTEETGLIIPLGAWVLAAACRQMKIWHDLFPSPKPLIISVNLSGKQFTQENLISEIKQILIKTGFNPRCLKLEITESVVMDDVEKAIAMLAELRALDVQLGMDDFGTGYSSLSYLHRFPTDMLKIDRSFVNRMGDEGENLAIVRTIVALAHNLGMQVIAEGVETASQLAQLRSLGCEYGQGYFFSKPVDSKTAEALLIKDPQW